MSIMMFYFSHHKVHLLVHITFLVISRTSTERTVQDLQFVSMYLVQLLFIVKVADF